MKNRNSSNCVDDDECVRVTLDFETKKRFGKWKTKNFWAIRDDSNRSDKHL